MFYKLVLPVFFILLLMIYQADPIGYENNIDDIFSNILEKFDLQLSEKPINETEKSSILISKAIYVMVKSAIFSVMGIAYITAYIASIVPIEAESLFFIWIGLVIISAIPWNFILGLGFLAKDWWKKRKLKKREEEKT